MSPGVSNPPWGPVGPRRVWRPCVRDPCGRRWRWWWRVGDGGVRGVVGCGGGGDGGGGDGGGGYGGGGGGGGGAPPSEHPMAGGADPALPPLQVLQPVPRGAAGAAEHLGRTS